MTVSLDDMMAGLDPEQRRRIEERAEELIAEEMTLRELREARKLTQVSVARELGISQDAISRLERRSDLLLSTLRRTVKAVGGSLSLIARFPDRALRYRRARRPRLTPPRRTPPTLASGSRCCRLQPLNSQYGSSNCCSRYSWWHGSSSVRRLSCCPSRQCLFPH